MNALYFLLGFAFCMAVMAGHPGKAILWALVLLVLVVADYWRE